MNAETYELLAHGASYWFIILAAILVLRGIGNSREDNRKERNLRAWSVGSGCVGELLVLEDGVKNAKKSIRGARLLIPTEGLIGSGGVADVQIRHADVARKHVWFTYRSGELHIRPAGRAKVQCPTDANGRMVLRDGEHLVIGRVELVLTFYSIQDAAHSGAAPARRLRPKKKDEDEYDDPFAESFWE